MKFWYFLLGLLLLTGVCFAEDEVQEEEATVDRDLGAEKEGSRTDDNVVQREEEAIQLDGLNVAQMKELRDKAEKHVFQAEINRMMKLIINSLYRNKEIFLRELISNASDALDKIRLLSVTNPSVLDSTDEFSIRIKADKENHMLHITDTGIGMTHDDLVANLGTIAKSGTSDFFAKMQEAAKEDALSDLIGQFGVGFYSSFLVADKVIVTSKHNDDKQYIWESDASSFSVVEDPRGPTLKRGTTISLKLKEESYDFLEQDTISNLIKKYSQFINFNIYLWSSKTEEVEEPLEEEETEKKEEPAKEDSDDEDGKVEEEEEEKPKTKKVQKTTWDWVLINDSKPIWTRKPADITDDEYHEFYKSISKDREDPLAKTHFVAEGEVTFKSLLFVPNQLPSETFQNYGAKTDNIKLYVRRVFITDDFADMMPKYLSFIRGVVDSDDLPLNVSRETLQQHKLLKVIKKKLVRKALDMIKKIKDADYQKFWNEFSTNIKLGVIEDSANRTRLARLLRFLSSNDDTKHTSLAEYVERMKDGQEHIYYMAGSDKDEVVNSPFVERLISKGYEVLYLTEPVDEYAISAIPEFDGKKFQNVAKEGVSIDKGDKAKDRLEALQKAFEPLTKWLQEDALKDKVSRATVSERLASSPCALVASRFGWSANMEKLNAANSYKKGGENMGSYYMNQKKTLEINPRHPLIKELLKRVEDNPADPEAKSTASMLFRTATLRSGYQLKDDLVSFAKDIEVLLRKNLDVPVDEKPDVEEEEGEEEEETAQANADDEEEAATEEQTEHDEL